MECAFGEQLGRNAIFVPGSKLCFRHREIRWHGLQWLARPGREATMSLLF